MKQAFSEWDIDLASKLRYVDVDHVVERRCPLLGFPDVAGEHLAGHGLPVIQREVFEQFEFLRGELDLFARPGHVPRDPVYLEVRDP
jgi:hypothetical protein